MYTNTLQAQIYGDDRGFRAYCASFSIVNSRIGGLRQKYTMRAANLRRYGKSVSGNYTWENTIALPAKRNAFLTYGG